MWEACSAGRSGAGRGLKSRGADHPSYRSLPGLEVFLCGRPALQGDRALAEVEESRCGAPLLQVPAGVGGLCLWEACSAGRRGADRGLKRRGAEHPSYRSLPGLEVFVCGRPALQGDGAPAEVEESRCGAPLLQVPAGVGGLSLWEACSAGRSGAGIGLKSRGAEHPPHPITGPCRGLRFGWIGPEAGTGTFEACSRSALIPGGRLTCVKAWIATHCVV